MTDGMEQNGVISEEEKKNLTLKEKAGVLWQWCKDHPAEMTALVPVFIGAVVEFIKIGAKKKTLKEEQRLKEEYIYDRSNGMGHWQELKRKPKTSEWIEIDARRRAGESLIVILRDLKLVK